MNERELARRLHAIIRSNAWQITRDANGKITLKRKNQKMSFQSTDDSTTCYYYRR